jgi:type II secretory pathway predicted ATPase ExeA
MYESFFGLRERPFDLTPNPRFLLLTGRHREALSNLQYGLMSRRGLTLLVGEAGTGKTTLIRAVIGDFENQGAVIAYLNNPTLTRAEFYEFVAEAYGLGAEAGASKFRLLRDLSQRLEERHAQGALTALIIDEAQALPDELLEEVRLLANTETSSDKLLPIVLAGQPELADRLNAPSLRQLKQRVALRCQLGALTPTETAEYIAGRIRVAGRQQRPGVHAPGRRCHLRAVGRHPSPHQRDLRQRPDFGLCRRPPPREPRHRRGRLPRFRPGLAPRKRERSRALQAGAGGARPATAVRSRQAAAPGGPVPAAADPDRAQGRKLFEHFTIRRRFLVLLRRERLTDDVTYR